MSNARAGKTAQRERAILLAARDVFVENGYEAASIAEIARRANVADGTIYTYFANKKELLHRVLADFVEDLALEVEQQTDGIPNTFDRLRYLISRHLTVLTVESQMCLLFFREAQVS
ncbi:MAG: TetR/AcrR family transcriptional regulator, partial [Methyloligellaceae bacterium]